MNSKKMESGIRMKILGLGNDNIRIFTKKELIKKGKDRLTYLKALPIEKKTLYFNNPKFFDDKMTDKFNKLKSEPMPYSLFRYNELFDYELNLVGCEITEEQYMERLEQLPLIPFNYDIYEGYIVPECITGNTYEHLLEHDKKFYCVIMEAKYKFKWVGVEE